MVAIWPYESLDERADIRQRAEAAHNPAWPPDSAELIVEMVSRIFLHAPFMCPLNPGKHGPLYEMQIYTYASEAVPVVLEAWAKNIETREGLFPLIGCWYTEYGGRPGNFVHLWAYSSFEDRLRIRQEARNQNIWPPPNPVIPVKQESKLLLPSPFSPGQ